MKKSAFLLAAGLSLLASGAIAKNPPHDMYNGIPCSTRFETAALPNGNLISCHLAWDMPLWSVPSGGNIKSSGQINCKANSYTHFDGNNRVVYCVTTSGSVYGSIPQKAKPQPVKITSQPNTVKVGPQPIKLK